MSERKRVARDLLLPAALGLLFLLGCRAEGSLAMSVPASAFPDPKARAFLEAVAEGDVDAAIQRARTLPEGANVVGMDGETALLVAIIRLDRPMVSALLSAGANPDGGPDRAPLAVAAQAKDLWFADALLEAGASPDTTNGGERPLHRAVLVNRRDMLDRLLDAGASIDAPSSNGYTATMLAAEIDDFPTVEHLLKRGASPFAIAGDGLSLAYLTRESSLSAERPRGQARDRVAAALRSAGVPWPPPSPAETLALQRSGRWPYPPRP